MENERNFDILFEEMRMLRVEVASLTAKLSEVIQDKPVEIAPETLDSKITALLQELQVPANIKGYGMIRDAIKMMVKDVTLIGAITKVLYPTLAKRYNTLPNRAERAIRHAIEVSYRRNPSHPYYLNFPNVKPSNSRFLGDIADRFRLEESRLQAVGQE